MVIRSLVIVAALCLCATSVSALTVEECRAKYKAAMSKHKSGVGTDWAGFQEKRCGISKASAPKPATAAPGKD
jgi:hypothetical protein